MDDDKKKLDSSLKLLAKSFFVVLIGVVLSKVLTYLFRIVVARRFGPEIYGLFSLASMIVLLFYSISSLGLPYGIIRNASIYRARDEIDKIRCIVKSSINISLFLSISAGIILFLTADFISLNIFHNSSLIVYLKFFSVIIPFYVLYSVFIGLMQAYEEIGWYSFIDNILQNALKLVILLILLAIGLKTSSIIVSYTFSIFFIFLAAFFVCKYKLPQVFKKTNMDKSEKEKIVRNLISYSWPLTLFALISLFFYWTDFFIIGYFKDATTVGIYNAAVPIASFLIFVPTLLLQLFFPLITKEFGKENFKVIRELSKQVTKWILILNLPLFAIMILFPGAFLNILFGPEYIVAKNSLIFLTIGSFFSSIFYLSNNLVSIIGKTKLILANILVVSVLNFILGVILIQKYGINGVAFATMLCNIILTLILSFEVKYYTSLIPLKRKMFGVLFSAAISTIALIYIRQFFLINLFTILIQLVFFMLIYTLMIFITKSLDGNDLMILEMIKDKIRFKKLEKIGFQDS
ncbi:MAG: flippase [Nanoarchaeota archaeon]